MKVANGPVPLPPRVPKDQPPVRPPLPSYTANIPKRQALPMPLPLEGGGVTRSLERNGLGGAPSGDGVFNMFSANINSTDLYTEPYRPVHRPADDINKIDIVSDDIAELSLDELTLR